MTKYPLCERFGLKVDNTLVYGAFPGQPKEHFTIKADDVEAFLAAGVEVYGDYDGKTFSVPDPRLGLKSGMSKPDTHKALLVGITKIKEETAEDLLRELIENMPNPAKNLESFKKARAWLEKQNANWKE